jgi:anti-anti-sigma factor
MISITIQTEKPVPVVLLAGRIDATTCTELDRAIVRLTERENCLIIDLSQCNYLSSAGIRILLVNEKILKSRGGGLFLYGLIPAVFQVLEMAGLHHIFRLFENLAGAESEIERLNHTAHGAVEWSFDQFLIRYQPLDNEKDTALEWRVSGIVGYNELGISVGIGSSAESPVEDPGMEGIFITTGQCAGFIPFDGAQPDEFRIPRNPSDSAIFVREAISFVHKPAGRMSLSKPGTLTLAQLTESLTPLRQRNLTGSSGLMAMVMVSFNPVTPSVTVCLIPGQESIGARNNPGLDSLSGCISTPEQAVIPAGARFLLSETPPSPADELSMSDFLARILTFENITGVVKLHPGDLIQNPVAWIFISDGVADASCKRILIDTADGCNFETHKAFLARRLYTDSARLVITPLHGGFSAQTFQVTSFDHEGRKLRPTVLKIADRAIIARESDRCSKYALPFILNNSALVLGTEFFGNTGALRYNFVGIGGEQNQLKWLTHYYKSWPADQLEPLFDKIFHQILHPWYGQPIPDTIFPFKEHDPTFTFFPQLCETAAEVLLVSADNQFVTIEETGETLINPYWFLKYEFPKRRETGIGYYTSICHGDLNMQNILLDEDMNVYLIDFSETKPRSLISDFARLEAIFMIEYAPLENDEDRAAYFKFISRFYQTVLLNTPPENSYEGNHRDLVSRNVVMTLKMRDYAFRGVKGHPNNLPYCMALLEWILPIVCYTSSSVAHKQLSMIVAGHLCDKVMSND